MTTQDLFEEAYLAYLRAIKQSWADVDIDELASKMAANDGNVMQGCGQAAFNCAGTLGTLGSAGTVSGCIGSFGTIGTFGCHVTEPETDDEEAPAAYGPGDTGYDSAEST